MRKSSRIDQIAEALAQIGRPLVARLAQALKAPEPRVRRGAALALGQIRPVPPGTAQKLTAGLADPDREVKGGIPHRHRLPRPASRRIRAGRACPAARYVRGDPQPGHRDPLSVGAAR